MRLAVTGFLYYNKLVADFNYIGNLNLYFNPITFKIFVLLNNVIHSQFKNGCSS